MMHYTTEPSPKHLRRVVSDETGGGLSQFDNSVRNGRSKPRKKEQERTETSSQPNRNYG
jgi:hypothetical protein